MSSSRSSRILHGAAGDLRAPSAAIAAHCAAWSPCRRTPPPMRRTSTVTRASGTPSMLGDDVLHLARVLGRGVDEHVAVLARDGERDLALEIEMLLPADAQRARRADAALAASAAALSPCANVVVGQDVRVGCERVVDRDAAASPVAISILASRAARRASSRVSRDDREQRPGRGTRSRPSAKIGSSCERPGRRRSCPECRPRSAPRRRPARRAPRRGRCRADAPARDRRAADARRAACPSGSRMSST